MRIRAASAVLVAVLGVALSGCSPVTASHMIAPDTVQAHQQFGQPAIAAPAGFTYQPDVVVVGGGHNAVLGGSADGFTWQLDSAAPGMSDVAVGKVLWATATVVGRVVKLTRGDRVTQVVLMPVPITDVIRDGELKADAPVAPQSVRPASTAAPQISVLPSGGPAIEQTSFVRAATTSQNNANWASGAAWGSSGGLTSAVDGWGVDANYAPDGLNMSVSHTGALKVAVDFGVKWHSLQVVTDTDIRSGAITSSQTAMKGLQELTVGLTGGAASPAADNTRIRLEVPATFEVPIDVGFPLLAQFRFTFIIATAFGGSNATIGASARWRLAGGIGTDHGQDLVPTFGVIKSLVNSIGGLSLAPSGIVFGFGLRVLFGIGAPGVAALGPYVKLAATIGVTNGSALGAPLVRCHAATLDIQFGVGAAAELNVQVVRVVKQILSRLANTSYGRVFKTKNTLSLGYAGEKTRTIISASQTVPDVPLCKAG